MRKITLKKIQSLPLTGKYPLYYYPDINLLTLDNAVERNSALPRNFGDTLFRYFLGLRKLTALKEVQQPPKTLFVEPWRTCNLACTYCYAESGPGHHNKIDRNKLVTFANKYPFRQAMVFGGEPLLDAPFLTELQRAKQWDSVFFSTNGLLLGEKASQDLIALPNIRFQISLEPGDWPYRVTANGERQLKLIKGKLPLLRDRNPEFRVTIPADAKHFPLKQFICELADELGSQKFSISYWPARTDASIPWMHRWAQESYELIQNDPEEKYSNKLPGHQIITYFREGVKSKFRYYNCNAAHGSVAMGPDNDIHACHELAIIEDKSDIVSTGGGTPDIDDSKRAGIAYKWSAGMKPGTCGKCDARYLCGGICFLIGAPNSACSFISGMIESGLTGLVRYNPSEVMDLTARSEERFKQLLGLMPGMTKEVNCQKWNRLVSGELPLGEATELANQFLKS